MDELFDFIDRYGLTATVAILVAINLWRYVIPGLVEFWKQGKSAERRIRQQEHFATLHYDATRDERYAILTDRIYDQLDQANDFIRSDVGLKLVEITDRLQLLETRLSLMVQVMETIYDKNNIKASPPERETSSGDNQK